MDKIIIVGGLTATGKTEIAVELAKKFNGELINADSRQIYKYLDIGTNKGSIDTEVNNLSAGNYSIQRIPLHLINIITPDQKFDLYRYQILAKEKIKDIRNRNKIPIIVGGTGLYIDSIIKDYQFNNISNKFVPEKKEFEKPDRKYLESLSKEVLQKIVKQYLQKESELNNSDWNNPRRLIRIIEKGEVSTKKSFSNNKLSHLLIYPQYNWDRLRIKINNRVMEMFNQGFIEEVQNILKIGYKETDPGLQIMGYKEVVQFLNNSTSLDKCIELIQMAHRQYARRQRTWFEGTGRDYRLTKISNIEEALSSAQEYLLS